MGLMIVTDGQYEEHADLKDVVDLGYVCVNGGRSTKGNQLLTEAVKRIVFGEANAPPDMLEQLFADPANFDLT